MEGLLSLLLFAGAFFVMMRFCCGTHMMHGGHGRDAQPSVAQPDHLDPVCGMSVDPGAGYGKMHEGRLYRFCSRKCLDRFDADPGCYTGPKRPEDKP